MTEVYKKDFLAEDMNRKGKDKGKDKGKTSWQCHVIWTRNVSKG